MESLNAGGAEKVLIELLKFIDYSLFDITLVLYWKEGVYLSDISDNVHTIGLFKKRNILSRLFFRMSRNGFDMPLRILLNKKLEHCTDLSISFMEGIPVKMQDLYVSSAQRLSWVHTDLLSDHWTRSFFTPGTEELIYGKCQQILFVSKVSLNNFKKVFPHVYARMDTFYNPIDKETIQNNILPEKGKNNVFSIVSVGRLTVQKSYDKLISAVAILKNRGKIVRLQIVGDGPLREQLDILVDNLNLNSEVSLFGYQKNPYAFMAKADLFVSSSYVEGYPLVICEALCLGIPVLATETAGALEILEGGYGYIVNHTPESLADGIEKLIDNPELLMRYKLKAKERSLSFDINKTVKEFEFLLSDKCI